MSLSLRELFLKGQNFSTKHEKYFDVYEENFSKYRGKDIIFVEIGIFNGGSLKVWKEYLGPNAKVIGIDINPECKKFEEDGIKVHIGNQSDPNFWDSFFQKVGMVDVILDDGGHTNLDQIITTAKCIDKINDDGVLMVEDTHCSYIELYNSSDKLSFINFAKKIIDDVNFTFPLDINKKMQFNYSLNKYIYSSHFYESIVVFRINRKKAIKNSKIKNQGTHHGIEDLVIQGNELHIQKIKKFTNKINFISLRKITKFLRKRINNKILKKFFN
jgi:hypothetical protein|tara:strand:+ start:444 stop:1259 length:816 start_codon:yes stop_codon:yes gene_type:complete